MVDPAKREQECNNRTQTVVSGLGQDKRTGTFWSHVIDGVEEFEEPARGGRFLSKPVPSNFQRLGRDLSLEAAP